METFALIKLWQHRNSVLVDSLESRWNDELERKGYISQLGREIMSKCNTESWIESLLKQLIMEKLEIPHKVYILVNKMALMSSFHF